MKLDYIVSVDNLDMRERLREFGDIKSELSIAGQHMIFMTAEQSQTLEIIKLNGVLRITEQSEDGYVLLKD